LLALLSLVALFGLLSSGARAVEAIVVKPDQDKYDVTSLGELYEGRGDRLQIETAPGPDGYVGRMAVQPVRTNPAAPVRFDQPTAERVVRYCGTPLYCNTCAWSARADAAFTAAVTPRHQPEPLRATADVFRLNLRGQTITSL
jgi:hypothetical protein